METARVVARPAPGEARHTRWERIAREAVKQCGRVVVPEIDRTRAFADVTGEIGGHDAAWVCWEGGGQALAAAAADAGAPARLLLLVGPEGGFTSEEVGAGRSSGGAPREPRPADPPRRVGGAHGVALVSVPVRGPGRPRPRAGAGRGGPPVTLEGYEYFDVAADVGVAAWGEDLPGCLRQCALGVFNLIVPTGAVQPLEGREVAARGPSVEASW